MVSTVHLAWHLAEWRHPRLSPQFPFLRMQKIPRVGSDCNFEWMKIDYFTLTFSAFTIFTLSSLSVYVSYFDKKNFNGNLSCYRTNLLFGKVLRHQQASIEPETWPMFLLNSTSAFTKQNPSFRLKQIQSISYLFPQFTFDRFRECDTFVASWRAPSKLFM